jgi:hypothetical protein
MVGGASFRDTSILWEARGFGRAPAAAACASGAATALTAACMRPTRTP